MGTLCEGTVITSNGQKTGRIQTLDRETRGGGRRVLRSPPRLPGSEKKEPEPQFFPPMSFINERKTALSETACMADDRRASHGNGVGASPRLR